MRSAVSLKSLGSKQFSFTSLSDVTQVVTNALNGVILLSGRFTGIENEFIAKQKILFD